MPRVVGLDLGIPLWHLRAVLPNRCDRNTTALTYLVLGGDAGSYPLTNQMNVRLIPSMGRIAGVTAAQTRERLLQAAADVFAERGYDGTRVADIAAAAGVSNGAMYAHFALEGRPARRRAAHARAATACRPVRRRPSRSITDLLLVIGRWLPQPPRRPRLPHRRGAGRGPPRRGRRQADARLRRRARRLARRT